MKTCQTCGIEKEFDEFYKDTSKEDNLTKECKDCRKARSKQWRAENHEEYIVWQRKYRSRNDNTINS